MKIELVGDWIEINNEWMAKVVTSLSEAGWMRLKDALVAFEDRENDVDNEAYKRGYAEGFRDGESGAEYDEEE